MNLDGKFNFARKECTVMCDICGRSRTKGQAAANHRKCSQIRQAHYRALAIKISAPQ